MNQPSVLSSSSAATTTTLPDNQHEVENLISSTDQNVQTIAIAKLCDQCVKPATKTCTTCKRVYYCNVSCQKAAWTHHHKHICVPFLETKRYAIQDAIGLTPLHYAVLYKRESTLAQEQQKMLTVVLNSFGGTPNDLKGHMRTPSEDVISVRMLHPTGGEKMLTQEEFLQLTGVRFKEGFVASPDALLNFHLHPNTPSSTLMINSNNRGVAKFVNTPPLVFLAEEPGIGMGLQAGQDIEEGAIICCSGGEFSLTQRNTYRSAMYRNHDGAEQDTYSGLGSFVNDGPPNCVFTMINNFRGIPYYTVVMAIRRIAKGEFLHLFYGPDHEMRGGKYSISEESYREIVSFCQDNLFYQVGGSLGSDKWTLYQTELFDYIFSVSTVFILLHLREVLQTSKTRKLMQNPKVILLMSNMNPTYYNMYNELLCVIDKILEINKTDKKILSSVEGLARALSEAAFVKMLSIMMTDQELTSKSIAAYQTLGELCDHLYLVANGTLYGTYLGKDEGPNHVKTPDIRLDLSFIFAKYLTLPFALKNVFETQLKTYMLKLGRHKQRDKFAEFLAISASLNITSK